MKCLYHANCNDGMAAALAVYMAQGGNQKTDYIPVQYGSEPPWDVIDGQAVIMVDFSYKRPQLAEMANRCLSVLILDHHKSAERELEGINRIPNIEAQFDMERSGAVMAWDYFNPGKRRSERPMLYDYVQDRDLWRKELPYSDAVTMYLRSYPMTLTVWRDFLTTPIEVMRREGLGIYRWFHLECEQMVEAWHRQPAWSMIGGHCVPVINAPGFFSSEVAGLLAQGQPFAAAYFHIADFVVYSLRRREGNVDLSEVAALQGGGGHPAAAGFQRNAPFPIYTTPMRE